MISRDYINKYVEKLVPNLEKAIGELTIRLVDGERVDTGIINVSALKNIMHTVKDCYTMIDAAPDERVNAFSDLLDVIDAALTEPCAAVDGGADLSAPTD